MDPFNHSIPFYIQLFILTSCLGLFTFIRFKLYAITKPTERKLLNLIFAGLSVFYVTVLSLAYFRFFLHFDLPPRILILFLAIFVGLLLVFKTKATRNIINRIEPESIVLFQVWRFLPELLILFLIGENLLPELMTFTGLNYDILAPITAPLVYVLLKKKPNDQWVMKLAVLWNILSMLILGFTVVNAVLAMPWPFQQHFVTPINTVATYFPIILLPIFMVPLAFAGHILALVGLLNRLRIGEEQAYVNRKLKVN